MAQCSKLCDYTDLSNVAVYLFLLGHVRWEIVVLVINMYESAVNIRHTLYQSC